MIQASPRPPSERPLPPRVPATAARRLLFPALLFPALLCAALFFPAAPRAAAAPPAGPQKADLVVVIFSIPGLPDAIGATYADDPGNAQVEADLKAVAQRLGSTAGPIEVTRKEGSTSGETNISGLANRTTGVLELDPLIWAFKRYGHFHVWYMLSNSFPLQSPEPFSQGSIRVEPHIQRSPDGTSITADYEIWVDQRNGPPQNVPSVRSGQAGWSWKWMGGIAALAALFLLGVVLIVKGMRPRHRGQR